MPHIQFEGFKFNLNSALLVAQLLGFAIFALTQVVTTPDKDRALLSAQVTDLRQQIQDNRNDVRLLRTQDTAVATLKADVENIKLGLARIERTLETRLK